ncbi:hypothetical protein [Alkanindiges illinoisensis]|uniref:hypothetical protein n=1 Tax=Alkanindiges illinoisensis TaxID=197183 RepID=UPI0012EC3A3C|nr:hypothetical protein [Alkanindiges illinoisensis]
MDQITISNTALAFLQHPLFIAPYLNPFAPVVLICITLKTLALLFHNHHFFRRI